MRWRKLGLVHAPTGDRPWARQYAHLPTPALRDPATVRVYFAGLDAEKFGRVGYVDVTAADPTRVIAESADPVLDLGAIGSFDDCGVVPSCVVDEGGRRRLYYVGFQRAERCPYMLFTAPVAEGQRLPWAQAPEWEWQGLDRLKTPRSRIPAVTHVDGSARVQTVDARRHGRFYRLVRRFFERTGCPVLVNTSFNVRGEPIVCTPADAYRCFLNTDLDALVVENHLLLKEEQTPALPVRRDHGQARDRLRVELAVRNDAQPAGPLRDQHSPIRKKRDRPGMLEPLHDIHDPEAVLLGANFLRRGESRQQQRDQCNTHTATIRP